MQKKTYFVEYRNQSKKIETVKIEIQDTFLSVINPNKKKQGMISGFFKNKTSKKSQILILYFPFLIC